MNNFRLQSTVVALGLLTALTAMPAAADRDDDRGGRMLRKAPESSESQFGRDSDARPGRSDHDARPEPRRPQPVPDRGPSERLYRAPPPSTPSPERRDLRKDAPPVAQPPRAREPGRERHEPDRRMHPQPAPERREIRPPSPRVAPSPLPKPPPGYILDKRHSHNRYYPPHGHVVPSLPTGHRHIIHRGVHYHYHAGVWYRPSGPRFVVVLPPPGIIVRVLPPYYTIIWVGAVPYYYAGGVYYLWYPEYAYYRVVEAPPEPEIRENPPGSDELFVYPKEGQSAERQAQDRYECHRWAVDQTGFDPTLPGGNVWRSEYDSKRADYRRAMKACLEGRGYSVQ